MRFKSAIDLKSEILDRVPDQTLHTKSPDFAIGIAPGVSAGEYKIAIRVSERDTLTDRLISKIAEYAAGELDVRISLQVDNTLLPSAVAKQQVLSPGSSVAHYRCSAGTLGFFARRTLDNVVGLVSCNHIIAAQDTGVDGDEILSPAPADGGNRVRNVVAYLDGSYGRLRSKSPIDCAFAAISIGLPYELLADLGRPLSARIANIEDAPVVIKHGRTTARTRGRVTAFDLSNIHVAYAVGSVTFDSAIEITSLGAEPFSKPGDSGALVFTEELSPLALLYASTVNGVAYAHPLRDVTTVLGIELIV